MQPPTEGTLTATPAATSTLARNAAFWTALAAVSGGVGVGVGARARAPRAGLLAGGAVAALFGLVRWQLARWFTPAPGYYVERTVDGVEVRRYPARVEARTTVEASSFDDALDAGFRRLAGYIFGGNHQGEALAMTAPVSTRGEHLAMTAPVTLAGTTGRYTMTFVMPPGRTLGSLPQPDDPRVELTEVPPRRIAALTFRGRYTGRRVAEREHELMRRLAQAGMVARGTPAFAGYDPPSTLPWVRRNEVWVEIEPVPAPPRAPDRGPRVTVAR